MPEAGTIGAPPAAANEFIPGQEFRSTDFENFVSGRNPTQPLSGDAHQPPATGKETPGAGQEGGAGTKKASTAAPNGQAADETELEGLVLGSTSETPEQKMSRIEREYKASSSEARRLKSLVDRYEKTIKAQGLDPVEDEESETFALVANDKYSKEAKDLKVDFSKMSDDDKALLEADPQAFVDKILATAKRALSKAMPTLAKKPAELSPERKTAAISHLKEVLFPGSDTEKVHPNFEKNLALVEKRLADPKTSKALREFANAEPEEAFALLSLDIDHKRAFLTRAHEARARAAEQKKQDAVNTPDFGGGSGGGSASVGQDGGDPSQIMAKLIAQA